MGARGEGFAHVSVALVLLVYQVVGGGDVVVPIGFEASDRVLFFKLEVVDQTLQQILCVGHLLQSREEARLTDLGECVLLGTSHVGMIPDFRNANTGLWVSVQDLLNEVLALWRQEFRHLVVSGHDLFVQIGRLWILEGQVPSHHSVENHTTGPDICLKTMVALASNHLKGKKE